MKKFITEYEGKLIKDTGVTCSEEFKSFTRKFKNAVKREFPNTTLTGFKPNHYDFSGFITFEDGKTIYVSYSMPRGVRLDLRREGASGGILVRTAKNVRDYTGGHNHFCNFYDFKKTVEQVREWND